MSCIIKGQRTGEFLNNAFWTITVCNTTINTTSVRRKISAKLTLNCIQQDRKQKPRSTWQAKLLSQPMIFRQGAQHRRCRSLIFESTITRDCERHEFRNTVNIFLFPLGNQCWTHLCLVRHFWFVSKREKKCVSKDIFCSHKSRRSVSAVSVKIPSTFRSLGLLTTTSTSSSHKKNGR